MESSSRVLNSSTGIASHPLALLTAVLPKVLFLCTPECLVLGDWQHHHSNLVHLGLFIQLFILIFLYSSSMYSFCLFLISSGSTRSPSFLSFIVCLLSWVKCSLDSSSFSKEVAGFSLVCFLLVSCTFLWRPSSRPSRRSSVCLCMLFFGTWHLIGYTLNFLTFFLLSSFFSYLLKLPNITSLPYFSLGWLCSLPLVHSMDLYPSSIRYTVS